MILKEGKEIPKDFQKVRVEKFSYNRDLNIFWKLSQESFISLILNTQAFVFIPFVLKECLYVGSELFWDLFAVIKSLDKRKETIKLFGILHLTIECLHFLDHVIEFTNNIAEDCISKQYDNGA